MQLTDRELDILEAAMHTKPDCGSHVSIGALEKAVPAIPEHEFKNVLHNLKDLELLELDEHDCAIPTEKGIAAAKSM